MQGRSIETDHVTQSYFYCTNSVLYLRLLLIKHFTDGNVNIQSKIDILK